MKIAPIFARAERPPLSLDDRGRKAASMLDTFDLIVVINLDHRKDRLREIGRQLEAVGLDFTHPQLVRLSASCFETAGEFPSIGARGCYHSHLNALRLAEARGARSVLIVEDDADFVGEIAETLDELRGRNWSVFYGGHLERRDDQDGASPRIVDDCHFISSLCPRSAIMGAHFIGFRGRAIPAVIAHLEGIMSRPQGHADGGAMHVDGAYNWARRANPELRNYIAERPIAVQRSSRSDIAALKWWDQLPVSRELAALARGLRR